MSFLSPTYYHVTREIVLKLIHVEEKKHLENNSDFPPLGSPVSWACSILLAEALAKMLTRHRNHFVVSVMNFSQPLHLHPVHMENDFSPIRFRSNIRKRADLHSWQKGGTGSGALWCQRQGISNPARAGEVGSLLFPVFLPGIDAWMAFSWALFFLLSFLFLFFFLFLFSFLNTTAMLYHLHRCTTLITFWVTHDFCSNTRLSFAAKLGNSKPPLVLAPWSEERRASQCLNLFTMCTKDVPLCYQRVSKEQSPLWIMFPYLEAMFM